MSAALNIGSRALMTNLSALQVIGHNIANANTDGYSRQSVQTQSAGYQMMGGLYFGKGVELASVTRAHNSYLTREAQVATSVAASDAERYSRMQQLEAVFPIGEEGLGAAVNDMLNAWTDVASSPTDLSARVVALARGDELAARMRETAGQIDILASSSAQQAKGTVTTINRLAEDIASINQRIIETQGTNGAPNDLLDQRDQLLSELSQHVQLSTVAADDGSVSVFVGGSQPLVLGTKANSLAVERSSEDPSQWQINFLQGNVSHKMADGALGGSLGGVMLFLNEDLPAMQNLLGRMALAVNTIVNEQHSLGVDLQGNPGADFFVPVADTAGIAAASNTGNADVQVAVTDPTAFQASDYQLSFDAGGVTVTRLSDNTSTSFATLPAELDGLSFDVASGGGALGDSFLVRPFANVARNMQMAIGSPSHLAVASPVLATPGVANGGGMSIESMHASSTLSSPIAPATIEFFDGYYTINGVDPGVPYTPGEPINYDGWSLTLRGSPQVGDTFTVDAAPAGSTAQNAGNAEAMLSLRDLATFNGVSMSEGYGVLVSHLGTQVQSAKFSASYSGQMATTTETARASVAGVNLDEEAARLLQFQQAYQASAKFLQIAQGTFDTLLQTVGR